MNEHLLNQAVCLDMAWAVNSPSLLAPHPLVWQPDVLNSLNFQELNLTKLELEQCQTRKLGLYFETIAGLLFDRHPRFQVLARNRAIHHQQATLGEFDLLLKDLETEEILHLELAVKFYLHVPTVSPASLAWIGAGQKDFFHHKLNRLFHHQLQLPNLAKKAQCWPQDLPFPDRSAVWIPGRLYLAHGSDTVAIDNSTIAGTPWQINDQVLQSVWYDESNISIDHYQALTKPGWLRGGSFARQPKPLPAQFSHPLQPNPVYVLPRNWQTGAEIALNTYKATL